jgi:hypothetical protein
LKRATILIIVLLVLLPATAFPQGRKRTARRPARSAAQPTADARAQGAARVADQIKVLTKFLYLLGGVSKGIEAADEAARRNEASAAILAQTQQNKVTVRTSLKNVREGLDKLEIDFRSTSALQPYYEKLAGVAAGAATAEDLAAAGKFDQSGRSLLQVVSQLTDVLRDMR